MNISVHKKMTPIYYTGTKQCHSIWREKTVFREFLTSPIRVVNMFWCIAHKSLTGTHPPYHLKLEKTEDYLVRDNLSLVYLVIRKSLVETFAEAAILK